MYSSAFPSIATDGASITFTLVSDLRSVHPAIRLAEQFARQCGAGDTSKICIVLQELLSNAIVHGNQDVPERTVKCSIRRTPEGQFRIVVEDEGEGFDFAGLDMSFPEDPRSIHKRGYVLIHHICDALEFNERGNRVTVLVNASERKDRTILSASSSA